MSSCKILKLLQLIPDCKRSSIEKKRNAFLASTSSEIVCIWRANVNATHHLVDDRENSRRDSVFLSSQICVSTFLPLALSTTDVFARCAIAKAFMQIAISLFIEVGKCSSSRLQTLVAGKTLSQQFNIKLPYSNVLLSLTYRKQDKGNWRILFSRCNTYHWG